MGIGTSLRELLNKRNIRPAEFADKIGVPRSTINSIINRDNNKIDIEILFKMCDELHISTDEFLGYKRIEGILISKEEEKVITAYRACYCKEVIQRALGIIPKETTTIYRVARSEDNHPAEIVETTTDFSKIPPTDIEL